MVYQELLVSSASAFKQHNVLSPTRDHRRQLREVEGLRRKAVGSGSNYEANRRFGRVDTVHIFWGGCKSQIKSTFYTESSVLARSLARTPVQLFRWLSALVRKLARVVLATRDWPVSRREVGVSGWSAVRPESEQEEKKEPSSSKISTGQLWSALINLTQQIIMASATTTAAAAAAATTAASAPRACVHARHCSSSGGDELWFGELWHGHLLLLFAKLVLSDR